MTHAPADNRPADTDLAIIIVTAPVWIAWFVVRIVAAAWRDWRRA